MFHLGDGPTSFRITMYGGKHIILDSFVPEQVLETIQNEKITSVILIPTMINLCVHHPNILKYDVSSLKTLIFGGAPMSAETFRKTLSYFKNARLLHSYGLTETSPLLTYLSSDTLLSFSSSNFEKRLLSCGIPFPGVLLRVVNDKGEEVEENGEEIGEVIAKSALVMKGYWRREDATKETIKDGWLFSGDLATRDSDGFIYIVDRKKDMIVSGGENVYSTEVENAIYKHPQVIEAAVIGIPDPKWGEIVGAAIYIKEGKSVTEAEIIAHCHKYIGGFKCPKKVDIYTEPLPKSGVGKILKRVLREKYWKNEVRQVHGS